MKFFKLSLVAVFCSLLVGFMPNFLKFALNDKNLFSASVIGSQPSRQNKEANSSNAVRILQSSRAKISVYIADNEAKRTKGLGGLSYLPAGYGMFFIFDSADYQSIWMKDMLFPIDIIWIDDRNTIVHVEKNISPKTFPKIFTPPVKARFVLELNANMAENFSLNVGEKLFF